MTPLRYFLFCLKLHFRQRREVALPLFFFLMVSSLFPLTFSSQHLPVIAPVTLWISALLAILLSLNNLFREDVEDGFLIQLLLSPAPLSILIAVKLLAHGLAYLLPLFATLPVFALWYNYPWDSFSILALSLALGTPTLLILGAVAAALAAGLKQSGMLLMLITLPLTTPILLFGLSMAEMASNGLPWAAPCDFLLAMAVVSVSVGPWVVASSLKLGVS
ncbi:MAG: heme exporter protein CcmB [Proteobacteria bacterium]|nr:heme exporter protein CcmB [Pseudomonadota bacterium]